MEFEDKMKFPENIRRFMGMLPTIELFHALQDYNNQMLEQSQRKTELLLKYNRKLFQKEYKLSSLLSVVEEKTKYWKAESQLFKSDEMAENEWDTRVKIERQKRLSCLQEYQTKMAALRSTVKSSVVFNDKQVAQEISEIRHRAESMSHCISHLSQLLTTKQAECLLDADKETIIEHLNSLTEEFKISALQDASEIMKLEEDLNQINEAIQKMELNCQ